MAILNNQRVFPTKLVFFLRPKTLESPGSKAGWLELGAAGPAEAKPAKLRPKGTSAELERWRLTRYERNI